MSKQTSHQQAKFPLPPGNEPPSSNFNPTNPPHIVFVGDLSFFCNEDRLYELFSSFGRVVHVEIERGKATGDSLLHGLVEMDSLIAAEQALTSLSGSKFMGRKLRLSRTNRNPSTESDRDRETWVQIHVSFVTRQLDKLVNEEALETIFASFGEIADVIVKRHKITKDPKSQNGYGFVYYVDIESATNAIYVMKRAMIEGVTYDCNLSYRSEEKFVNPQKLQTSGPKSEVPSPPMSIPPHSYSPYPAPPAHVAVAVYPPYSTATNPPPYNPPSTQSSSSSYPRNPPTAVSNTLHPLHPPHPPPPQNMYLNHRQMPDQYHAPRTFDGRTNAPYPPTSSPQLSMQQLPHHHYNVGIIGFPQSTMIPPSHAPPPPPVQMTTSPQIDFSSGYHTLSSLSFSPQQSFSPHQYSIYGTVPTLPPSPFESYSNLRPSPPSRSMLPLSSMMIDPLRAVPEIITHHRSDSRNVRRQRQGNLRRMEDYQTSISASISRSDSRDYIPNFRGEQHNYSSNSNNHHSQSNHHHGTHSSNNTTTNSSNSNNIQKTGSTDDSGKYKDERKRI